MKKHQGTDEEFQMDYPEQKIYISNFDLGEKAIIEMMLHSTSAIGLINLIL